TGVLHLFDTAVGAPVAVRLRQPGQLSMYVCGPTVSGEPHLGHGRFSVTWDVLRRYMAWSGIDVRLVSNITDIDDKIIARAAAEGRSTGAVAEHYERVWWDSMDGLGVQRPTEDPHATAWVPQMVALIGGLVEDGHAYVGGDGVYFSASSVADYGLLAHQDLAELRAGARVEVDEGAGKRAPADFVLWKLAKPGEPSWDSPWGAGRPGWHTECVVMSLGLLGDGFDVHGGGLDLVFPHHENERAQAVAAGHQFARHWVHSGMVVAFGGEKMSKSLGNVVSLPELLDGYDARAFRLRVLQAHYRSPLTVTDGTMADAVSTLRGLDQWAAEMAPARGGAVDRSAVDEFRAWMDQDLNTPRAVALLFELGRRARAGDRAAAATVFELWETALGLPLGRADAEVPASVLARVEARNQARARKDWAASDALRDVLAAEGWIVEDGPEGTKIHR
ncbi:MAG: cysteine--tRNA ligase, partial [Acidimicrobiales bacterium]